MLGYVCVRERQREEGIGRDWENSIFLFIFPY